MCIFLTVTVLQKSIDTEYLSHTVNGIFTYGGGTVYDFHTLADDGNDIH